MCKLWGQTIAEMLLIRGEAQKLLEITEKLKHVTKQAHINALDLAFYVL